MSGSWNLTIHILGYWRAGTGRGAGVGVDAIVRRDDLGLPLLPGRHLRGLLRDAVETLSDLGDDVVPPGTADRLFGRAAGIGETRHDGTPGMVAVGSARLSDSWLDYARQLRASEGTASADRSLSPLFARLSSTAIDPDTGTAKSKSLRTIEVSVPMTVHATLTGPLDEADVRILTRAASWVRAVGGGRGGM